MSSGPSARKEKPRVSAFISADIAKITALLATSTAPNAKLFPPNAYAFIVNGEEVNTGGLLVRGMDLSGSYDLPLGPNNRLSFSADGTLLCSHALHCCIGTKPG